jgi:hypothetical protein
LMSERTKVFARGLPELVLHCALPKGEEADIYANDVAAGDQIVTDPAGYCADWWRDEGQEPPDLAAYANGSAEIKVVPADQDVSPSWRPYTYEPVAPAVLELQTSLNDYVDGLQSDCFDAEDGRALVERELRRLGLNEWRVTVRDGSATSGCAGASPSFSDQEIEIVPGLDAGADENAFTPIADKVRSTVGRCLTVDKAATRIRKLIRDHESPRYEILDGEVLRPYERSVTEHVDPDAECTRADINYYGMWLDIVVRGPKA